MKTKELNEAKKKNIQKWPKVAIIILNWNGWKDTIECLESVFRNNYPNYQVIVIDNGSTNGSMEKIKEWAEGKQEVLTPEPSHPLYHLSHPPVKKPIPYIYYTREEAERGGNFKLEEKATKEWGERRKFNSKWLDPTSFYPLIFIQTGENLGYAGGNNVGIRYAIEKSGSNYIWLINNDTVINKKALLEMVRLMEKDKKVGMVGSKLLYYDKKDIIQALGGNDQINWKIIGKHICSFEKDQPKFDTNFEIKGYICGASLLVKKEVIKITGMFDDNYFMLVEDTDWCFRAYKKGWKLFYNGKSKVWHKDGASTKLKKNVEKMFLGRGSVRHSLNRDIMNSYYTRNHLYFVKKHFNKYFKIACLVLFLKILRKLIGIILYDDFKLLRIKILLKGFYDGVKGNTGKFIETYSNK